MSEGEPWVGSEAVLIESLLLGFYGAIIFAFTTEWSYFWVFQVLWMLAFLLMLLRTMARQADEPNLRFIKGSLRWSSVLSETVLISVLATLSVQLHHYLNFLEPVALYALLAFALSTSTALIDQFVLGRYADIWSSAIYEGTGEGFVGQRLRGVADFGKEVLEGVTTQNPAEPSVSAPKALGVGIVLFAVLLLLGLPIWLVLSRLFGGWLMGVLAVFSLFFLRDLTRYVYLGYGSAESISELRWPLKISFPLMVLKGILLGGALGYNLSSLL